MSLHKHDVYLALSLCREFIVLERVGSRVIVEAWYLPSSSIRLASLFRIDFLAQISHNSLTLHCSWTSMTQIRRGFSHKVNLKGSMKIISPLVMYLCCHAFSSIIDS